MPRHVRPKGRAQASKRRDEKKRWKINYRLLLLDIQSKATLEQMQSSKTRERRHRHCLL